LASNKRLAFEQDNSSVNIKGDKSIETSYLYKVVMEKNIDEDIIGL
jgi:hypothetical protein